MYKPVYFRPNEIFPPEIIKMFTVNGVVSNNIWMLMDERILLAADCLRLRYGICYINHNGMTQRGFRTDEKVGAKFSQHRYGRALDINFKNVTVKEVRDYIINNPSLFVGITAVENVDGWLHIDCRNCEPIMVFNQ